jgi:hypothetical protein
MAKTQIADIIQPAVFNPYVIKETMAKSALFQSGIVQPVPELQLGVGKGNRTINMPYFTDLTGNSQLLSDSSALVPKKIGTNQDVAVQLFRGDAWSSNDLAGTLSGADPQGAIGNLVAGYWARDFQATLISMLNGVFNPTGGTLGTTHTNKISIEDGNAATSTNKISAGAVIDTMSKLGDAYDQLTAIVMHSVPYFNLVKQDLIQFIQPSGADVQIPTFLGKRVIVDDGCPVVAGTTSGFKYTSYLFGAGAVGYAEGTPEVPTETDRDSLAGDDILVNRKHYVLHPRGVKFTNTTVAGVSPSNTELALVANWSKVYEDKAIRMVSMVTNG